MKPLKARNQQIGQQAQIFLLKRNGMFQGKLVLITSCSPGSLGGIRAAAHIKSFLSGVGCVVFPEMVIVPNASSAFDDKGDLADENLRRKTVATTQHFHQLTKKINA